MLTVLGGLVEFERDLIRTRTGEGRDVKMGRPPKLTPHQQREAIKRFDQGKEITCRERAQLQRKRGDDFKVVRATMSRDFQIVQLNINEEALKKADPRIRTNFVGWMYVPTMN